MIKSLLILGVSLLLPIISISAQDRKKETRQEKDEFPDVTAYFEKGFWFCEDVTVDPRDSYSYFETLEETIKEVKKRKMISPLFVWMRFLPDTNVVSFIIPFKDYTELGSIQEKWIAVKKAFPSIAPA